MEGSQNTNEQPQEFPLSEINETSENIPTSTTTTTPELKEETPTPPPQPETTDHQLQTTEMEVHKHPHHVMHKKKWGEYLLEFSMIFFAVFLGFLAENLRERISERHREKEFAVQLYDELKQDSIVVFNKISERKQKEQAMEYVSSYLKDSSLENAPEQFYPAFAITLYLINRYAFEPKDGILNQLRNSGSIRYLRSVYLQKLLGDISVSINNIRNRNDQEYQYWSNPIKPFMLKHFDFDWLTQLRSLNDSLAIHDLLYNYEKYNFHLKGKVLNSQALDKNEGANMILFYRQMMISTRTLQLNEYIAINHKILEELRQNYRMSNE